ncbi:MAG TPA: gluconate 2-dehydrogenase subunit 3 family protein [Longimicrobiales bacterium]|nr:gluconate 2-dehydrogenase subunit 3 family protein [Longimicrobiales bacterium]
MAHEETVTRDVMDRREAIRRVTAVLGGLTLVGGEALLTACERGDRIGDGAGSAFSADEIAFLDEIAETILPETGTPGAKAARTGAFMALMVTDTYDAEEQRTFREGMRAVDEACRRAHDVDFMVATPEQRLDVLRVLDRDQKARSDEIAERNRTRSLAFLSDQRQEASTEGDAGGAAAITADPPTHYFRMMKELVLLGYFTSEIGCKQAQRYIEAPGRYDPCVPYQPGDRAWAPHA